MSIIDNIKHTSSVAQPMSSNCSTRLKAFSEIVQVRIFGDTCTLCYQLHLSCSSSRNCFCVWNKSVVPVLGALVTLATHQARLRKYPQPNSPSGTPHLRNSENCSGYVQANQLRYHHVSSMRFQNSNVTFALTLKPWQHHCQCKQQLLVLMWLRCNKSAQNSRQWHNHDSYNDWSI